MKLNERVKIARVFAGLSIVQLAARLELAKSNIIRWESDSKYNLPQKQIRRVAAATGVPAAFLEGRSMEGLVVARPGRFITKNARENTYKYLDSILALLINNDTANVVNLRHERRKATILYNEDLCIVIVPADEFVPLGKDFKHQKQLDIDEKLLADAYDSDTGVDNLLQTAGITKFMTCNKSTTINLQLSGGNKRQAIDKLLALVDELRREGCDVHIEITDRTTID